MSKNPWQQYTWRSLLTLNPISLIKSWRTRRQSLKAMYDDFDSEQSDDMGMQ